MQSKLLSSTWPVLLAANTLCGQEQRPALEPMAGDAAACCHSMSWKAASPIPVMDLGRQDGFYRNTQLQGHLTQDGLNLFKVPTWWTENSDFPYLKKDSEREVFFVDLISVTRFLGGFNQEWKHNGLQLPANDLAYVDDDGTVRYRLELVEKRILPYLENGYRDFIINIENTPWDLSRIKNVSGPFGNASPPRDWEEWEKFIRAVCEELARVLPEETQARIKFKIGNEYNQKKSFKGDHEDFLKLYDYSSAAILSVFPHAEIMPGEIGGPARSPDNAIDYPDLFQHFIDGENRAGLEAPSPARVLARSSHSFPHVNDLSPSARVRASIDTMTDVLRRKPRDFVDNLRLEHHQFGVLGAPDEPSAYQTGVRAASWQFQTIFRLKAAGFLNRVWSWDKAERIVFADGGETHLLNGIGWLYSILDHLEGSVMYHLGSFLPEGVERDVTTVAFSGKDHFTLIMGSWTALNAANQGPARILVPIPEDILPFPLRDARVRFLRLDPEDNPFEAIRADLKEADLLKDAYLDPSQPTAQLRNMATDFAAGRQLVDDNLQAYIAIQQESLQLRDLPAECVAFHAPVRSEHIEATVELKQDDLVVLRFQANAR